jgi:hypothetical protein
MSTATEVAMKVQTDLKAGGGSGGGLSIGVAVVVIVDVNLFGGCCKSRC